MTITDNRTSTLEGRLRAARIFAGVEQKEIADDLGVSRQTVSNWETGRNPIPGPSMIRWAERCRVSLDWLGFGTVRPEGFEPPTYWSVASPGRMFMSDECVDDNHDDCLDLEDCTCYCHDREWTALRVSDWALAA